MKFELSLFSPDGPFTADEVKELIEIGLNEKYEKKGVFIRMLPVSVREIK